MLVFGLMLMLLMIFRPQGILVPRAAPRRAPSSPTATEKSA
jgi:ABC-type branched-subunit amino acid transport system permease subunit